MAKFVDLTGKTFGRLKVLYKCDYKNNNKIVYHCRCSCENHTELDVIGACLKRGTTLSCGCLNKEIVSKLNKQDITNKRYGNLVALYENGRNAKNEIVWHCKCDCGNFIDATVGSLNYGKIKSCKECSDKRIKEQAHNLNFKNLTGQTFGRLKVLGQYGKQDNNVTWKCMCSCGNKPVVSSHALLSGATLSCGCYAREINSLRKKGKRQTDYTYPKWFIDELANEEDKILAMNNTLVSTKVVSFICVKHGEYTQRVSDHIVLSNGKRRYGCPLCANTLHFSGSSNENEIRNYVLKLLPNEIIERANILEIGKRKKEIDIYIPRLKIGIEYNGSAFHASENGVYGNKDRYYHRDKFLQAKKQGIHLITVFDKDYEENKWLILERIRHILLDNDKKFFIPNNDTEYTDNDYDTGEWLLDYGYHYVGQKEPESFIYNKFLVYRSGISIWEYNK